MKNDTYKGVTQTAIKPYAILGPGIIKMRCNAQKTVRGGVIMRDTNSNTSQVLFVSAMVFFFFQWKREPLRQLSYEIPGYGTIVYA